MNVESHAALAASSDVALSGPGGFARQWWKGPLGWPACLLLAACCMLLSGCIGGSSAATRFYLLSPPPGGAPGVTGVTGTPGAIGASGAPVSGESGQRARLAVGPVNVASYLDRPQIVTREGDGVRLSLAEFDRWAEPLSESLPRVLAENVSRSLGGDRVLVFPGARAEDADMHVAVDVMRLDGAPGGVVVLDAWWVLLDRSATPLRRGRFVERKAAGGDYASLVAAQGELAKSLADVIAGAARELLPRR